MPSHLSHCWGHKPLEAQGTISHFPLLHLHGDVEPGVGAGFCCCIIRSWIEIVKEEGLGPKTLV